ncbi:Choline transporter-like protein 2 [Amphibalanus amphitrite]|uniref:Choline transporter-like protein n=1 Tax=Amphibalanus amphitrite TaxID=1232801 RepID=A0A6A4W2F6_AMPAM|nr:choline transporter-like 2 [Amphibalanus amphitrite]KAF0302147.1 Choline transporter-like protein 2 [Amphibalanus amphitrite]
MTGIESASPGQKGPYGRPRSYDPDFHGPVHKRSCTDILCALLFFVFMIGWAGVGAYAIYYGDPEILAFPTDSDGRKCGRDPEVADKKFLLYFDLTQCSSPIVLIAGCPTPQVCVSQCPQENRFAVPYGLDERLCTDAARRSLTCRPGVNPMDRSRSCRSLLRDTDDCAPYTFRSAAVLGRCVPNLGIGDFDEDNDKVKDADGKEMNVTMDALYKGAEKLGVFVSLKDFGVEAVSDYRESWWVIVLALVACMVVSLLWILLMRFVAGLMVWLALLGSLAGLIGGCVYTFIRWRQLADVPGADKKINPLDAFTKGFDSFLELQQTWLIFFIILCVLATILLLVVLILCKRLRVAIEVIDHASRAVTSTLSTLAFPLLPWLLQLGTVVLFTTLALYIASMGRAKYLVSSLPQSCRNVCGGYVFNGTCDPDAFEKSCRTDCPEAECRFVQYEKFEIVPYLHAYNIFAMFWSLFFLSAMGEMVLAGAFSSWYWTFDKSKNLPPAPLSSSMGRTFRYHLGTLAFGSLIIAIIRVIRVTLEYIYKKCKSKPGSQVARAILCCCRCCMWCLEKFMRFINRNAYIMTATYGTNFCKSARDAFMLIMRNVLRVIAVDAVCDFLLFLGKALITIGITVASFYFLDHRIPIEGLDKFVPETHYSWLPVVTIAVGCFFISSLFFSVYNMAVDTLFLCFLEDLERNDGSEERPYYMSKDMMKVLGKKNRRVKAD